MIDRSSPHVHTQYCDGKSTAREMVQSALDKNFVSLGFSSHALQNFDLAYALTPEDEISYIAEIKQLKGEYADRLPIWLGMERDSLSIADRGKFEYVIGSVHYFEPLVGEKTAVDGPKDLVRQLIDSTFSGDGFQLTLAYYKQLGEYISRYKPDIIGHFHLIKKHRTALNLFEEEGPKYIKAATEAMDLCVTGCKLLEVNTGALARSGAKEPYPSLKLLEYWRSIGGQVILSSDCHYAPQLDAGYDLGLALINNAGYKKAAFLGRQDDLFEWCDL